MPVPLPKISIKAVEKIIAGLLSNNLQLDLGLSARFQEQERESVKPVYRTISKGSVLIEQGERFTEDKVAMFKAHQAEMERNFSPENRWRQRAGIAAMVALIVGAAILTLIFQQPFESVVVIGSIVAGFIGVLHLVFVICLCIWRTLSVRSAPRSRRPFCRIASMLVAS